MLALALEAEKPVRFIRPIRTVSVARMGGTDIGVQVLVAPHPENRAFRLAWGGDGCPGGASTKALDGEYERAFQPHIEPIKVRVYDGVCTFEASVYGAGGTLRGRAQLEFRTCGDNAACR